MNSPWKCTRQFVSAALFLAALGILPNQPASADYFVATVGGMQRFSDAGDLFFNNSGVGESVGGMALGPDGLLYVSTNDLGFGTIYRFNPTTNAFLDVPGSNFGFNTFPIGQPGPMAFGAGGDLFMIATNYDGMSEPTSQHVTRIDPSGHFVAMLDGAIADPYEPPGVPLFTDLAVRANGDVFVAKSDGSIQRHTVNTADTILADTLESGVDGVEWMSFGPDGLLYLRESVHNSIIRYDVDAEALVDTWVTNVPNTDSPTPPSGYGPFAGDIFFGPAGDLLAVNNNDLFDSSSVSHLIRLEGETGELESIVASHGPGPLFDGFQSHGLYVAVPEPSSALVVITTIVASLVSRQRSLRRR